jgi:hypothetical protein
MTTRSKKFVLLASLLAGIFFIVGFLGSTQLPKIRSWILVQVENQSRDHLPVKILPTAVEINGSASPFHSGSFFKGSFAYHR